MSPMMKRVLLEKRKIKVVEMENINKKEIIKSIVVIILN